MTNPSTEDRSIPAIIARLRDGDSDGDDHDMAANEIERLNLARLQAIHEHDCAVVDVERLVLKLSNIRVRALNLAQRIDKGCEPKDAAIEASFIALMAKEPSDDATAERK